MRTRSVIILFVPLCLALGCGDDSPGGSSQDAGTTPDAAATSDGALPDTSASSDAPVSTSVSVEARACASLVSCLNDTFSYDGMGRCVEILTGLGSWFHWADMTMLLGRNDDHDWLPLLATAQNLACVAGAGTCEGVLACLNGGTPNPTCEAPEGYQLRRRCASSTKLSGCNNEVGVGVTVDCTAFGQQCIELASDEDTLALCGQPGSAADGTVKVTCNGTVATADTMGALFTLDCAVYGATCAPGTYDMEQGFEDWAFCVGSTLCSGAANERCDGTVLIDCGSNGETRTDCAHMGMTCAEYGTESLPQARCVYPGCTVGASETCSDGVVTYCGPDGPTQIDCSALGYAGCHVEEVATPNEAWCTR
jgi:hypothetical protein